MVIHHETSTQEDKACEDDPPKVKTPPPILNVPKVPPKYIVLQQLHVQVAAQKRLER